jgi:hypothetical protein
MFRPCWVIFRENNLVMLLDARIQLSENVPLLSSSVEGVPFTVRGPPDPGQYNKYNSITDYSF